ncbi:hypothetical protein [Paracraurococcus lichenis]|uniref:Uncharacterized protein n=1 Tax=Paracraurococcus lichenis TaxID=3064888 RepID=A0ABT9E3B7_9PROT|nr:hypothetical protein [Paracraurococcus sp. LOR1-02]MDO9710653.1 hypothetical protein [Paracraurococcus sp. LOR1-02]
MSMLHELAVKSELLLNCQFEVESPAVTIESYRAEIRRIGLTKAGRLDLAAVAISFKEVMIPVLKFFPFLLASDGYPSWWLQVFLAGGSRVIKQPLLHLLVEQWLTRASSVRDDDGRRDILRVTRAKNPGRGSVAGCQPEIRDAISASQVAKAAHRIRSKVPLTRVTRMKLAGELGILTFSSHSRAERVWPLTSQAILGEVETFEVFFQRRLKYEIEKLTAEGREPRVHLVLKRLGHRNRHADVAQGIAAWKAQSRSS